MSETNINLLKNSLIGLSGGNLWSKISLILPSWWKTAIFLPSGLIWAAKVLLWCAGSPQSFLEVKEGSVNSIIGWHYYINRCVKIFRLYRNPFWVISSLVVMMEFTTSCTDYIVTTICFKDCLGLDTGIVATHILCWPVEKLPNSIL